MNKKIIFIILLFALTLSKLFSETILLAQVIVYDKDNNIISDFENPSKRIYSEISKYWFDGLLTIKNLDSKKYGEVYTTIDANRICAAEENEYIIFGYIQENETNWFINLKLYDYSTKKVLTEFYSSDDNLHYDRLLDTLTANIISGIEEITGFSKTQEIEDKIRPFEIKLPISPFYWSPIDQNWNSKLLGIIGGDLGVWLYPKQYKIVLGTILFDFSLRPQFSYSYAKGKRDTYPLNYHGISFVLPILIQFHFNLKNSMYIGCGPYYEIELLTINPKYENKQLIYQNMFGLETIIGYSFNINRIIDLFTEVKIDFHFNNDTFVAIKPTIGISFDVYGGSK